MAIQIGGDPVPLMRQLARMAGIGDGVPIRRMVLVLDVNDVPILYTEGFLRGVDEPLAETELRHEEKPVIVNTTTMQDERYHTYKRVR